MTIAQDGRAAVSTPADVLTAISSLQPAIAERAHEVEQAGRVPLGLLDTLTDAGCFRLLLPPSHGGLGADLPTAMRALEALAHADASVAWTAMIGAGSWLDLAHLPRSTFDAMFGGSGDVIVAGAFNPSGSITPVDGGYRVTGRWSFASGCQHATWIFGNCVEGVEDGMPRLRIAVFAPDDVVIEDTWHVSGLAGTASHHFHVDDVFVPAERTADPMTGAPCIDEPIVRIPPPATLSLAIASVALGTARGALDDILTLATGKVPLLAPGPLAANPLFQLELATADTEVRAARALVHETAERLWAQAVEGTPLTLEQQARVRAAGVWATERAAAAVDTAYRSGGGSSLYRDSTLQRRMRDVHAITQHFIVKRDTLTTAGAILAGQDPDVLVF